jgi:hypothetical protein
MRFPGKKDNKSTQPHSGIAVQLCRNVFRRLLCLPADERCFLCFHGDAPCVTEDAPLHLPAAEIGACELMLTEKVSHKNKNPRKYLTFREIKNEVF